MYKLLILSLTALVACALAGPTSNGVEVTEDAVDVVESMSTVTTHQDKLQQDIIEAEIKNAANGFASFCVESGRNTTELLNSARNKVSQDIFEAFFNTYDNSDWEAAKAKDVQLAEQSKQIHEATKAASSGQGQSEEDQMREIIARARPTGWLGNVKGFTGAALDVVTTVWSGIYHETKRRVLAIFEKITLDYEKLTEACNALSQHREELKNEFDRFKKQVEAAAETEEARIYARDVTFDTVGCLTTGRLGAFENICFAYAIVGPAIRDAFPSKQSTQDQQAESNQTN